MISRAYTADEVRADFIAHCKALVRYWARVKDPHYQDPEERLSGLLHSFLCTIDGVSGGSPGFSLKVSVHPDDKAYNIDLGENYYENDQEINAGLMLHDLLYSKQEKP